MSMLNQNAFEAVIETPYGVPNASARQELLPISSDLTESTNRVLWDNGDHFTARDGLLVSLASEGRGYRVMFRFAEKNGEHVRASGIKSSIFDSKPAARRWANRLMFGRPCLA
jgi:hypothetical protein